MLKLYICYVIFVQKKRSDYIKRYINWKLISNDEVILNKYNVECNFNDNIITYIEEDNIKNQIDISKKIYKRDTLEFTFIIDFKNKHFKYILKGYDYNIEDTLVNGEFNYNNNEIILIYNIEDEDKKIIVQLLQ